MSALFIWFIFHLLCRIYAPESGPIDETTTDGPQHATLEFGSAEDDESTVNQSLIHNIEEIQEKLNEESSKNNTETIGESSSQTNRLILPPDISNTPLVLFAQNFNFASLSTSSEQTAKTNFFTSDNKNPPYILVQDMEKFYLCPHPSLKEKLQRYFDDDKFAKRCLYQTIFQENESEVCETQIKPEIIEVFYQEPSKCVQQNQPFQRLYVVGNRFCYPVFITSQGKQIYNKGINKFVEESSTQSSQYEFSSKDLLAYFICYNIATKRTIYTIHSIRPTFPLVNSERDYFNLKSLSSESFDITQNRFEAMRRAFRTQEKNLNYLILPYKLVPKAEKQSIFWQLSTSHFSNVAPLWLFVIPMMRLIEQHLRNFAALTSQSLTIQTIVLPLPAEFSKLPSKQELLNPSVWIKVVIDDKSELGIIIVVYSTPFLIPPPNQLCGIPTECEFARWTEMQIANKTLHIQMSDSMYRFAYCCKTLKTPMPFLLRFNNVLDINSEYSDFHSSHERPTKRAKQE